MTLGDRIKQIRQSLGWTQGRLAKEAEISKSFLSEIENNKSNISGENLLKLANALNASLDYLMTGQPELNEGPPKPIEIPPELSDIAEELSFSYRETLSLLTAHQSLLARRSSKEESKMTKEMWRGLYKSLKPYLE